MSVLCECGRRRKKVPSYSKRDECHGGSGEVLRSIFEGGLVQEKDSSRCVGLFEVAGTQQAATCGGLDSSVLYCCLLNVQPVLVGNEPCRILLLGLRVLGACE